MYEFIEKKEEKVFPFTFLECVCVCNHASGKEMMEGVYFWGLCATK